MKNVKRMFTESERETIEQQAVGKPSGVLVTIAGFEFDLVPLTLEQGNRVFELIEAFSVLQTRAAGEGAAATSDIAMLELIAKHGRTISQLIRDVLFESANAAGQIDYKKRGEAVFNEWAARLPLKETLNELFPGVVKANGLVSMLGPNPSTPANAKDTASAPAADQTPSTKTGQEPASASV